MIEIKPASVKKDNKKKGDKTVKKDASTKDILHNVKSKPNYLPRFLKNEIFLSLLKEINNFLINERENIVKDTEDMTEQDAIQYISEVVMQYLKTEKTDIMNALTRFDKRISTYASMIYLLQYTNKYVKDIYEAMSGTGGSRNIKFIIDFLDLSMSKTYLHTIKGIKTMLNSIDYTLINPKTQNEFDLLPGYPANRRITIQCPNKHKYSTTPNYIKNLMLKGKNLCQICYIISKIKYSFEYMVQKTQERGDELIFPKTKGEWNSIKGNPENRQIIVKCGNCKELRKCLASTYDLYERCRTCYYLESRVWTWDAVRDMVFEKGFRLYKFNQKMFDDQKVKPSIRNIQVQCKTCGWIKWTTSNEMANDWRFECGQCGVRSAEGICRWTIEKIFSYLANQLKNDPVKAVKFSNQFQEWLQKVQNKDKIFLNFDKAWPNWLKEGFSNPEYDGFNKFMMLAFEYNGKQHYNILTMTKAFCGNDKKLGRLKFNQQWKLDKFKVSKSEEVGVILLVVPYRVKSFDFQKFIFLEFKRFTGIDLNEFNIPYFDFSQRNKFLRGPNQKQLDEFS